jgi:UDP-N-acetylglucosamine--N-acetylmuramyl-(pentapeptide) pyrophosphoryl-undecaprenol N-acetylglucosamine transferase
VIGYYIHHHGRGHLARADVVAGATDEPVVALSSLPEPARHNFADWVALASDPPLSDALDPRGGEALHWSPLDSPDYSERMQQIATWVGSSRPRLVVADVSVEVTALIRLLGVPVVVVAGPGVRTDDAHTLGYRLATHVIAPWPRAVMEPTHLEPFRHKTTYVGAMSRFDTRPVTAPLGRRAVLILNGAGGTAITRAHVEHLGTTHPTWNWRAVGGADLPWSDDVWSELMRADVVVTHAGLSALAEVAAARRPAVVIPQTRPFGEQHETALALDRAGLATTYATWPGDWDTVLPAAVARSGLAWSQWNDGEGARRFAHCLAAVDPVGCRVG